jgi:hypothetical protein
MTIQEMLQQLREKGWSDTAIGDAVGVSRITVYRWRMGQVPANEKMLALSLQRLLRWRRPPPRKDPGGASSAKSCRYP